MKSVLPLAVVGLLACNGRSSPPPASEAYSGITSLHRQGIARTCAVNGGVCHNGREYPDLRTVNALIAAVAQPCNVATDRKENVKDACEPIGDRLVVTSLGIDDEIARVRLGPVDAPVGAVVSAELMLAHERSPGGKAGRDVVVRRGDVDIALEGAVATVVGPRIVSLDLAEVDLGVRQFLDDRVYPWTSAMVRVADVNGNGVLGHGTATPLIMPGNPSRSFIMLRLTDPAHGDLMPRQCRTWEDGATRALGCWIEGLKVDERGRPVNALDPIDYQRCKFVVPAGGRCSTQRPVDCGAAAGEFAEVQAVFARHCAGSSCHTDAEQPAGGLDLRPDRARANLVGVVATGRQDAIRVASSPDASYLLCKLVPECAERVGERMPLDGTPLSECELTALRAWIAAGAR